MRSFLSRSSGLHHTLQAEFQERGYTLPFILDNLREGLLEPVNVDKARSTFTDERLKDLGSIFCLPLDIRIMCSVNGNQTFRFENALGPTNKELVILTATRV